MLDEPLRERLHAQRMLALYRCGRQADALEAYRAARAALVEQVGVEPGPELRRLHEAILRQDAALDHAGGDVPRPPAPAADERARAATARPPGRRREPHRGRAPAAARGRGRPGGRHRRAGGRPGACGARRVRRRLGGGLPVQGPGLVRRRRRRVLLRPRAARRRARRAADRCAADRDRRAVGQRQVVGAAGGPAPGALGGRAAGQRALADRAPAARGAAAAGARAGGRRTRGRAAPGRGGRPVRGALHGLPRRGRARGVRRRADRVHARPAPARARAARRARRLLRALRGVSGAVAAAGGQPRARRADAPRRAAPGDRAARPPRRPGGRAGARRRAARRTSRASPARCRCCPPRCSSSGSTATGGACGSAPTSRPGASTGRSRGWPSAPTSGSTPSAVRSRAGSCCGSPARARATRSCAAGCRWPSWRASPAAASPRSSPRWPTIGWSRSARARSRSRTRRCCASGRGCAHGSTRTPRDAACTGTLIDAAREWDSGGRDPGELYRGARLAAALEWSAGHADELNATEREFLARSRTASERSHRRLRALLAGLAALLALAVAAGVVALEQRGNARAEATAAVAQRLGARALVENDLDRSLLLARQGVALDDSVQTRGNLLAALVKSPAAIGVMRGDGDGIDDGRPQPRRAHARRRRSVRQRLPVRHAHAAAARQLPSGRRPLVDHPARLQPRRPPPRGRTRLAAREPGHRVRQPQPRGPGEDHAAGAQVRRLPAVLGRRHDARCERRPHSTGQGRRFSSATTRVRAAACSVPSRSTTVTGRRRFRRATAPGL